MTASLPGPWDRAWQSRGLGRLGHMARWTPRLISSVLVGLLPLAAWGDNTGPFSSHSIMVGGTPSEASLSDASPERWYVTNVTAGRSYCAETQGGVAFDTSPTASVIDTVLTVLEGDLQTVAGTNNNVHGNEPGAYTLSRVCFIADGTYVVFIKVTRFSDGTAFNVRLRMVETTLWCPWFFVGGDFNAFTLLRNTTNTPVNAVVTWRYASGAVMATTNAAIPPNGAFTPNVKTFAPGAVNGSVEISHDGSPDALMGVTISISGSQGVSFETPCGQRRPW